MSNNKNRSSSVEKRRSRNNRRKWSVGGVQYAALPWRDTGSGRQIMLLTSRTTGRWVIPKGWPIEDLGPPDVACREAFEEAGLMGDIADQPIGSFHYTKNDTPAGLVLCEVQVFLLEVERQLRDWPEKDQRLTMWFEPDEAARQVHEPELAEIIRRFGDEHDP